MTRNLVVVRNGRDSLHPAWLTGDEPCFDLIEAPYQEIPTPPASGFCRYSLPGTKLDGYSRLFRTQPELLTKYDYIALFDDDIDCDATTINRLFAYGARYSLRLYQPSLTWESYFSYGIFLRSPITCLRFVNFVEMMCPVFSAPMLSKALPLFSLGLETAIDRLWCRLLHDWRNKFAVIDAAPVRHTRKVGQRSADQGFSDENAYQSTIDAAERMTGVRFRGPVAYAAILRNGTRVEGRLIMALISAVNLLAIKRPPGSRWHYRPILDHIRHNLTRPVGNEQIDLEKVAELLTPYEADRRIPAQR